MADDVQHLTWPLPKFYFLVKGLAGDATFQEVTGLDSESEVIEYRAGDSKSFSPIKMPGLRKRGAVTLHKGIFANDASLWDWYNTSKMNTIARRTVTIHLLDEGGKTTMTWTLANAWPTKITGTDLKSEGNEVAVETIELACETITAGQT